MPDGDDRRVGWYQQMLQIRLFEEKVQELFMGGRIEGTTHLCQGQEAVSVGAITTRLPAQRVRGLFRTVRTQ